MSNQISNSPQYSSLTTSLNGRNVMPLLQPKSHFFLQDNEFNQNEDQRFGAISDEVFNITSSISLTGAKQVFAICQGTVLIQPQTGSPDKVNLVLRPFRQPITNIPIKYFIYRGLKKSDFITTDNKIAGSETAGSGFVKYIWSEFNQFYNVTNGEVAPDFQAKYIGFPEEGSTQPEETLLDALFYKITTHTDETQTQETEETAYELPNIPRGTHLGSADGELGIDIILSTGDYQLDSDADLFQFNLAYVRAAKATIDLSAMTDAFLIKRQKEMVTRFIDVTAFYGLHANGAGQLYLGDSTTPLTGIDEIYGILDNFYAKNKTYIYIQANRQRSYDFYGNYQIAWDNANNLKIGDDVDSLLEHTFGTLGWPILEYTPTVTTAGEPTSFTLQLTTDNHNEAALYVQTGRLLSEHEENFVRRKNLLQENTDGATTKPLSLQVSSSQTNAIASFISLIYKGKRLVVEEHVSPPLPGESVKEAQLFLLKDTDDLFGLIDAQNLTQTKSNTELPSVLEECLKLVHFPDKRKNKVLSVVKTQRTTDAIKINDAENQVRTTFESIVHDLKKSNNTNTRSPSGHLDSVSSSTLQYSKERNNFYQLKFPYFFRLKSFTENDETINGLILETIDNSIPTKTILGITEEERKRLFALIQEKNLSNCRIYLHNRFNNEGDYYLSPENQYYQAFYLKIIGENTTGELKIYSLQEQITVYKIDDYTISSTDYGKWMPELNQDTQDEILITQI